MVITAELYRIIDQEKKRIKVRERRQEERAELIISCLTRKEALQRIPREEEETKKVRRRGAADKIFRGCTEEEAEKDLQQIFEGDRADRHMHTLPDGRVMTVIKKMVIMEGDIIRIEKGDSFEIGAVKTLYKGILTLECKEKEKKYPIAKLLSSRYTIVRQ